MSKEVYVGVSGFSYPSWKGRFYSPETKTEDFLSHYAQRLTSVEINSSFYAAPSAAMVKNWASKTNEEFRFSFKAPRLITHIQKLGKDSPDLAGRLSKTLESLGQRRGPVLFQLPPYSRANLDLLGDFLSKTSEIPKRVFEFRHDSWFQEPTYELLEKNGAGFCIAEGEELKTEFRVTGDFAYFRLRNESYDSKAIDRWAEKIAETMKGSSEGYVYLRHDETGENAVLAERLAKKLQAK